MTAPRTARGFRLARRGLSADECEDAWAVDAESIRVAVADGATESAYAGLWARLLVEEFTRELLADRWIASVERAGVERHADLRQPTRSTVARRLHLATFV